MGKWKNKTRRQQKVCQICACSDINKLEVHHILSRSLYPELKADERNLICLCSECHVYLHEVVQPLLGLAHNECDFNTLLILYKMIGNKRSWNKRKFMQRILAKDEEGYYEDHDI